MANKRLIEDLTRLERAKIDWREYGTEAHGKWVGDIASRALEEIEYLQSQLDYQIECRASDEAWRSFKPGDMK